MPSISNSARGPEGAERLEVPVAKATAELHELARDASRLQRGRSKRENARRAERTMGTEQSRALRKGCLQNRKSHSNRRSHLCDTLDARTLLPARDRGSRQAKSYMAEYHDPSSCLRKSGGAAGADVHMPEDTEWGKHEGAHVDPDGNVLRFGSPMM
jgi:hypothetical protein